MVLSFVALTGMVVGMAGRSLGTFMLVNKGVANATIVLPPSAPVYERRAAEILQTSVAKMSGATLPIKFDDSPSGSGLVEIGFSDTARTVALKRDGFAVDIDATSIRIHSGGRKGSIYAVIDLLEKYFGCRCFSPTVYHFPHRRTLGLPATSYSDGPTNSFRAINGDFSADPDWLDWQRLNNTDEMFGKGFYVHTFHRLVPPDAYFQNHPEYFAVINGKRDSSQLCPSRPENVDIAVETLRKAMIDDPDKAVWSVSQNDNQEYCKCPDCLKTIAEEGAPSGPLLRFVNSVARHFPNKTISTLAYEFSRSAPHVTKPDPNVQIMLCTIELTRSNPIPTDPTCASFRKDIVDWGRICHNIYLWDYTVDFAHQVAPFPNLPVLQPNIQFFVKNNALQHFQQSNTSPGHEFSELKSYVLARLLWNPDVDVKGITKEFLKGYFGQAAASIQDYLNAMSRNLKNSGARLDIFGSPVSHQKGFLAADAIRNYDLTFDHAEAAVSENPDLLQRVKVARLPIQYADLSIAADQAFGPRGFFEDIQGKPKLRSALREILESFESTCANNHVRSVNESNLTPPQFCLAIRRLLELEIEGNLAFRKSVSSVPQPSSKYGHGDVQLLTNGLHGSNDFTVQWLGWEGTDFDLTLDLGESKLAQEASVDSLNVWRSWILHPKAIQCSISEDGVQYHDVGTESVSGDLQHDSLIHGFRFRWPQTPVRFVRFHVSGTLELPSWHSAAGGKSWVFLDEITLK